MSSPQKFWEGLCKAAGHAELIDDPRFNTRPNRRTNYDDLAKTFGEVLQRKTARLTGWQRLEAKDVPHTPVYNMQEVFQDPQIKHMGLEIDDRTERQAEHSHRRVPEPIQRQQENPHPMPPPELGEHNAEYFEACWVIRTKRDG